MNNTKKWLIGLASLAMTLPVTVQAEDLWQVYQLALANDAQYQQARYAYEAAKQSAPIARSSLLPQIELTGSYTDTRNEITESSAPGFAPTGVNKFNDTGLGVTLGQSIYNHEYWMNLRQADATVAQAEAEYKAALQDLMVRTTQAYFDVLAAEDNLEFSEAEKEAVGRQLEQSQKRFEVGLIAITDVKESQASYDAAVAQEINARNQINITREALAVLTGQYIEQLTPLAEDVPLIIPEPDDMQAWVDMALEGNLSFLASQMNAKASGYAVKAARSGHYPYLDLFASWNQNERDVTETAGGFTAIDRTAEDTQIGIQLTLPIFSGLRVSSQTEQAAAQYNQALQGLEFSRRSTVQDARSSFLNVKAGIAEVQALKRTLESSRTSAEATQAGFQVGTRTAVDVLITLRNTFDAERNYALSRYNYILNWLRLARASGKLSEQQIQTVNSILTNAPQSGL
jgi:outer membrane protein